MNLPPTMSSVRSGPNKRWPLILLGVLFLGPFLGAIVMYVWFPNAAPAERLNHGQLITPARPVPALSLLVDGKAASTESLLWGKWTLVYLGGTPCEEACAERLYMTRQVRTRSRERERLQRVYVAPDAESLEAAKSRLTSLQPDLIWALDQSPEGHRLQDFIEPSDPLAIYLLDPHGNWLMVYKGGTQPQDLLSDLKKLLSLSQIG